MVVVFEITTAQFFIFFALATAQCYMVYRQRKQIERIKDREHSRKDY